MKRVWSLAAPAALALTLGSPAAASALSHGVLVSAPAETAAPAAVSVRGVSVVPAAGRAEVVIAVDGAVNIRDFTVEGPHRIVVDIEGARLNMPGNGYDRVARGGIRNVRLSQFNANVVRVVLDLDASREYSVLNADGAIRVSVTGPADFAAWSSGGSAPSAATVAQAPAAAPVIAPVVDTPVTASASDSRLFGAAAPPPPRVFTASPVAAAAVQQRQQQRITVTYENADIRDVLAGIAGMTGRTIVVGRDVTGEVSAEIRDQPWDVALQAILNSQGLAASEDASGIITVDSYANILARQSSEPLVTRLVQVNFVSAGSLTETVRSLLSRDCRAAAAAAAEPGQTAAGGGACATRGQVTADSATNSLLISEVPSRMGELLSYVRALDIRTPQVSIKGKLISVNRSATEQLGLSYDLGSAQGFSNRLAPRVDEDGAAATGDFLVQLGGNALVGIANADRRYGQSSAISLIFSTMLGKFSLTSFLDALSEERLSDVQAEPQATTLDNKKARIFVGQEVPVRTIDYGSGGGGSGGLPRATVEFRQTGIILEVTPHITNNRHILMDVYAEQSELEIVGGDLGFFAPRRDVKTQVLVRDGETMALGGLTQTQVTKNRAGIPFLSSLPLIGRLFSQTETREDKQDLLILLTPRIVDDAGAPAPAR